MFAVIVLPWPLDALFFKFQGLATDFALSIDLGRLYYHNKSLHKKASVGTLVATTDDDCESVDDYTRECDQLVQQLQQQQKELNDDSSKKLKYQVMVAPHSNVAIIYIAAALHAIGNALVTFTNYFHMWVECINIGLSTFHTDTKRLGGLFSNSFTAFHFPCMHTTALLNPMQAV